MTTGLVLSLLVLALVCWTEANERRAVFAQVRGSAVLRRCGRGAGWVLSGLALIVLAGLQGWERGVPIWLAWFSMTALLCLVFIGRFPGKHWWMGSIAGGTALVLGPAYIMGVILQAQN
ncbi:MAG: hypothetical protein AAGI89_05805 [Pseudomonadota bacterium]